MYKKQKSEVVRRMSLYPVLKFIDLPSGFSFQEKLCVGLSQFAFVSVFVAISQMNTVYWARISKFRCLGFALDAVENEPLKASRRFGWSSEI